MPQKDTVIKQNAFSLNQSGKADRDIQFFCQCCHTSPYCFLNSSAPRNEQDSHLLYPKVFQTSCIENFRQRLQGQGFPQEVSDILLSSWKKSTARQYESAWRLRSGWCDSWQIVFQHLSKNILTCLVHFFHKRGLQYRTINVYRSAISAFHISIDGVVIGKHPLVSKFMKGFFVYVPLNQNIL